MAIKYYQADDVRDLSLEIIKLLEWNHIHIDSVAFIRSRGSSARRTIARCHALGKAMQIGLGRKRGFYLIEVIAEHYDKQSEEEKIKTIIHELMHIPKAFGGGFIHHNIVHDKNVNIVYEKYINLKKKSDQPLNIVEDDFLERMGYKKPEKKPEKQSGLKKWF